MVQRNDLETCAQELRSLLSSCVCKASLNGPGARKELETLAVESSSVANLLIDLAVSSEQHKDMMIQFMFAGFKGSQRTMGVSRRLQTRFSTSLVTRWLGSQTLLAARRPPGNASSRGVERSGCRDYPMAQVGTNERVESR